MLMLILARTRRRQRGRAAVGATRTVRVKGDRFATEAREGAQQLQKPKDKLAGGVTFGADRMPRPVASTPNRQ
jgi:hypothetical protein